MVPLIYADIKFQSVDPNSTTIVVQIRVTDDITLSALKDHRTITDIIATISEMIGEAEESVTCTIGIIEKAA
jgi:hypothetical protein